MRCFFAKYRVVSSSLNDLRSRGGESRKAPAYSIQQGPAPRRDEHVTMLCQIACVMNSKVGRCIRQNFQDTKQAYHQKIFPFPIPLKVQQPLLHVLKADSSNNAGCFWMSWRTGLAFPPGVIMVAKKLPTAGMPICQLKQDGYSKMEEVFFLNVFFCREVMTFLLLDVFSLKVGR